jgi:DNA-directed RNA polymerase specialized sigma24 family protein
MHDPELLELVRAHNRAGAEVLYDRYAKVLSLAIYRIVQQKELTDHVLERTIYIIWNGFDQYNEQELPTLTWMLAIAKSLATAAMVNETNFLETGIKIEIKVA